VEQEQIHVVLKHICAPTFDPMEEKREEDLWQILHLWKVSCSDAQLCTMREGNRSWLQTNVETFLFHSLACHQTIYSCKVLFLQKYLYWVRNIKLEYSLPNARIYQCS